MIKIKNIYYMLSYAFQTLNDKGYNKIATEDFVNTADLFAEILIIGISRQIKQGLVKDYIEISETTSSPHGKINISKSMDTFHLKRVNCSYDDFSINCYLNQILKSTLYILIKSDIDNNRKKRLKKVLFYFSDVDLLDVSNINWKIRYDRNNQNYRMLLGICYLTVNSLLLSESKGKIKLMEFLDDQRMSRLYEKFLLNYYIKEYPEIHVSSPQIKWQLDDDFDFMLPKMQTDISLRNRSRLLIIDAKYYARNTQENWGVKTIHSQNLYQIFTYVKNKDVEFDGEVSGMLLYAKSDSDELDNEYNMSGNKISVKTLDLNQDFNQIRQQLDEIVEKYL